VNILLIAGRPPDPRGKGDAKIASHVSETLRSEGHTVVHAVPPPIVAISKTLNGLGALAGGQPLQVGVTRSRGLTREVKRILGMNDIDLTVAVHARTAHYVPRELRSRSIAFLYDSCALAYATYAGRLPYWMDPVFRLEQRRMVTYERSIVEQFGRVAVLASPDLQYLRSLTPRPTSVVRVPYAVDIAYFSQTVRHPVVDPPLFTFVGRLGYIPNQDAVRQLVTRVWPAIRARWPSARLRVVGARPGRRLRALLAEHRVELAADVDDVRTQLQETTALLVPMRMGTGVQTKVLEAMAAGVPVICTSFANAGLNATPDEHLLIADTPDAYVAQAERLLADAGFTERLVAGGRTWVFAQHAPAVFTASFMGMCSELAWQPRPISRPLIHSENLRAG
jgi:glycosyltransferase involved in cell wall biosynthesis